jgi:hypothetical protein
MDFPSSSFDPTQELIAPRAKLRVDALILVCYSARRFRNSKKEKGAEMMTINNILHPNTVSAVPFDGNGRYAVSVRPKPRS